jgi:hypothetical protein
MRFVTWNVKSMYRAGSLRAVAEEIHQILVPKIKTISKCMIVV